MSLYLQQSLAETRTFLDRRMNFEASGELMKKIGKGWRNRKKYTLNLQEFENRLSMHESIKFG